MRIGIVCYPTYGGSGVVATELGRFLAQRGHEVHFISSSVPFRLSHEPQDGVIFHEVQSVEYPVLPSELYTISVASKVTQVVELFRLDVVHVHYAVPHTISAFLARSALGREQHPFVVVTTLHGTDITLVGRQPSYYPIVRYAINRSDAVTTVSTWLKDMTIKEFGTTRPIDVIPNFVDETKFRRGLTPCKRGTYAPNGEKILLHISNFRPVKRVDDVVRIFARVRQQMPAVLLMIGDGPERERAQNVARELGVAASVHFLGKQESIEVFMSCADCFIFPSEYESFGLAALEAMACEMPVVASATGGLPEVIQDGETGYLAPLGDVEMMAEKALRVVRDPVLAARIGKAAREMVHQKYLPGAIVPMYEDVYENALRGSSLVRPAMFHGIEMADQGLGI